MWCVVMFCYSCKIQKLGKGKKNGRLLFTWLSLVMSLVVSSFVLSLFPRDVSGEIWV